MPSKLGIHVNHVSEPTAIRDFILTARPVVVKTLHHDAAFWQDIKSAYPELLLVGRKYRDDQPLTNPEGEAEDLAGWILDSSVANVYDVWEGYNEPPRSKRDRLYRFDRRMAEVLHENGLKYVAGSWSVGNPQISDWQEEGMLEALRAADYIGVHEYCAPRMDSEFQIYRADPDIQPEVGGYFTLRYRKWYPLLPTDCQKPLLITECGIDSGAAHWDPGAQGGWRSFTTAHGYLAQLQWYDRFLREDEYVVGATVFCYGNLDPTWETFELGAEMAALLAHYLSVQPPPPAQGIEELLARLAELEAENARLADQIAVVEQRIQVALTILRE